MRVAQADSSGGSSPCSPEALVALLDALDTLQRRIIERVEALLSSVNKLLDTRGRRPKRELREGWAVVSVHMEQEMFDALRLAADCRASQEGSRRPNVSELIRELLERHRDEIEKTKIGPIIPFM